ncbi:MAG: histidine--tRNA ligase [Bacteroidetes bacterium]|nr:histidine--tRNA ligase [Bacteroidota bacterium]
MNQERGIIPRKIKGFRDISPSMNLLRWKIIDAARKVYKLYGFEHWDTPILEYADCLGKYMPDEDTVDKGVYSFKNPEADPIYLKNGKEMRDSEGRVYMDNHFLSLRYDLTAPLSRLYAESLWSKNIKGMQGKPPLFRRYQYGPVFRYEQKLDPGRFREFWQIDYDSVGTSDVSADAEVCMVLSDALQAIGLDKKDFRIKVNNRKILQGFLAGLGVVKEENEQAILRIIDKIDKISLQGVEAELGQGRKDQSGAIITGLGLDKQLLNKIISFLDLFSTTGISRKDILTKIENQAGSHELTKEGLEELYIIDSLVESAGMDENSLIFSPTLVRGMAYYTGPIYEVESTQSYVDSKGQTRKVGSICGGGRYDGLVQQLLGLRIPATGASIGVDRLAELLMLSSQNVQKTEAPVLITVLEKNLMPEYQNIAKELRNGGIDTEVYYGEYQGFRKLKKQLAYADKKGCPIAILLGGNEIEKGVVTVRNLSLGKQLAEEITNKKEWTQRVQSEVSREELMNSIKNMLSK